ALRQPFLRLDPLEHRRAQSAEALRNRQPGVAAALEPFIVFERERSFFVVARGARRKVVGQFSREIDEAPLALSMKLIHRLLRVTPAASRESTRRTRAHSSCCSATDCD